MQFTADLTSLLDNILVQTEKYGRVKKRGRERERKKVREKKGFNFKQSISGGESQYMSSAMNCRKTFFYKDKDKHKLFSKINTNFFLQAGDGAHMGCLKRLILWAK